MNKTYETKFADIKREWHLVDVKGEILGRVATKIALLLMGKRKSYFVRHLDCGDFVVVVNAKHIQVTGNKPAQKIYTTYSGYPGGLRSESFAELMGRKPTEAIKRAVYGMLPKNKLRDSLAKRLYIYEELEHPYKEKIKTQSSNIKTNQKVE